MSNSNPERNLEVRYLISVPNRFSDSAGSMLDDSERQKLFQVSLKLGFLITFDKDHKYYFRRGKDITRIQIGALGDRIVDEEGIPYLDFNEFLNSEIESAINPEQDKDYLVGELKYNDSTPIQPAPQSIHNEARDLVTEAVDKVEKLLPSRIEPEIKIILKKAKEGVLVVKELPRTEAPSSEIISKLELRGAVIRPYNVILLDEDIFTNEEYTTAEKLHTVTHEVLHLISDSNLPNLLDEAATDVYAQRATGVDVDAKNLSGINHRLAYDLWHYLERKAGEVAAWQSYMEPAVFRVVRDKDTKKEVARSYTGLKLHDHMRQILDGKPVGESKWDTVLELIQVERILPATDLIYPLGLKIRSRMNYFNQFFR